MKKLSLALAWLLLCGLGAKYLPLWVDWIFMLWLTVLVVGASWRRGGWLNSNAAHNAFDLGFKFGRITGSEPYEGPPLRCPDGANYRRRRKEILLRRRASMTDIKALLLEAANAIDGDTPFNTEASISAVMAFDRRMAGLGRRLRAAAEAMGEPVMMIRRNAAGQIYMCGLDGGHFDLSKYVGEDLYLAPPPPAVPDEWEIKPCEDGGMPGFIIKSPRVDGLSRGTAVFKDTGDLREQLLYAMLTAPEQPKAGDWRLWGSTDLTREDREKLHQYYSKQEADHEPQK